MLHELALCVKELAVEVTEVLTADFGKAERNRAAVLVLILVYVLLDVFL